MRKELRKSKGFSLVEIIIAISVFALIVVSLAGWQVNEYKHAKAREIANVLLALDGAFYQYSLINNGTVILPPNAIWDNTTSEDNETPFVNVLRQIYNGYILLDPQINFKALALSGYKFTFIINNGRLTSIQVRGVLDNEQRRVLSAILKDRWSNDTYTLGAGRGYLVQFRR